MGSLLVLSAGSKNPLKRPDAKKGRNPDRCYTKNHFFETAQPSGVVAISKQFLGGSVPSRPVKVDENPLGIHGSSSVLMS